jgi:hypothetical protein
LSTLYKIIFSWEILSLWVIAWIIWWWFLLATSQIQKISHFSKAIIRTWGLIFISIFIITSLFYIWKEDIFSLILIPILCLAAQLLFYFHYKFQNYGAVTMGIFWYMWAIYWVYSVILSETIEKEYLWFLCFLFSGVILFVNKAYKRNFIYDTYFFHTLSLLVNLLWVFYFFYLRDFSILSLWLLLLWESIYLFFSYYTVSKTKTLW